jgi:AcrR family transcriptional regulator
MPQRASYHHGDLRNALIRAGAELAEQGGPEAVGIRAAARQVGVTPTAAYRHFASAMDLQCAVQENALDSLAVAMRTELANVDPDGEPADVALRHLNAIGRAYVRHGLDEPGLFRTAFVSIDGAPMNAEGRQLDTAFGTLSKALDDLVLSGYLPAERRPLAEFAAWSAVHGLVRLILDGPLADLDEASRDALVERTLEMIARGL